MNSRRLFKIFAIGLFLGIPFFGWTQRWNIYDSWRLRNYSPSSEVVELATQSSMNESSKKLFYVYHPSLDDNQTFSNHCNSSEQTIVLGCFVPNGGIYIYNVTDARLDGVKQVTAAHELLHAAYVRLTGNDKKKVDKQLNETFATITDTRIKETVENYRKKGADITNELHSILGTEIRTLPKELEDYYSRYFINRLSLVEFSEKYEKAFTERKQKISSLDAKLEQLKRQIDQNQSALDAKENQINVEKSRLDNLKAQQRYDEYNDSVDGFNALINQYNRDVSRLRSLIDQYNQLVAERNALVVEEGELIKAIDSRPATIDKQ